MNNEKQAGEDQLQEEQQPIISPAQEQEILNTELALITNDEERNEIKKVVKTSDVILIDSHKKKIKSFKSRFPAKKFAITPELVWDKAVYEKALEQWREVKNYRTKTAE